MSALTPPQEPGTKWVLGRKQWHYLGWSRAVRSSGGAAPRHGSAKPACTELGLQSPPASCLAAPCLSFPGSEQWGTRRAFAAQICRAFASCSHHCTGGSHSPLPSSRRGICGICFPGEAQAKQSRCRTPRRIWFPSPCCKNLLLLSSTLLQIRSGLRGFCSVMLQIQPWLTTENAPGFGPPKSNFAGQTPPPAPRCRGGFPASSAFSLAFRSPSAAPSPLAQGCLPPQLPSPGPSSAVPACRGFLGPTSTSRRAAGAAAALGAGKVRRG